MMNEQEGIYILQISLHGLIRSNELELGVDADTGGQTKYVVELTRQLTNQPEVSRVDLVTRLIRDEAVDPDYAVPEEPMGEKGRIIRIEGGPDEYLPKEQLWDHLENLSDNLIHWLKNQPRLPDVIHTHYADAGYVGTTVAGLFGIPLVYTGHSLGRDKRQKLLANGLTKSEINEKYNIVRRIEAEEDTLATANMVVTSTQQEIDEQYSYYDFYSPDKMTVIPPGTDLKSFHPPDYLEEDSREFKKVLNRFLRDGNKPMILALSRPDERKNINTLLDVFGESPELQKLANLVIVAGNRDDIREMPEGSQFVLTDLLQSVDYYDLYGRVAIPKHHTPDQVADIYRIVTATKGVFVNPALTEPFGLTLLEAAASGLPVIATENGGPVDILRNCKNGILVNPLDKGAIKKALLEILLDPEKWKKYSQSGLKGVHRYYSWGAHAKTYLKRLKPLLELGEKFPKPVQHRYSMRNSDRALFTDLDQNLLGNPAGLKHFIDVIRQNKKNFFFGIATGRRLDSALAVIKRYGIPSPDVLISSLGTSIHYTGQLTKDEFWSRHIDHLWQRGKIISLLSGLDGIKIQPKSEQNVFKISYHYNPAIAPSVEEINRLLRNEELTANAIHSFGQYLDILPSRASKGFALRYVAQRWEVPTEKILVAGGSGADEDMMRGNTLAVVVANRHHEELSGLEDLERIYFAKKPYAEGIIEATEYYDFFNECQYPEKNETNETVGN